jgi:hypothetical protein
LWKFCAVYTFQPFRNLLRQWGPKAYADVIPPVEEQFLYVVSYPELLTTASEYYGLNHRQSTILDKLSDSAILKKIERQPKGAAGYKQLVRELGLHGGARQQLSEHLERLVSGGQLIKVD